MNERKTEQQLMAVISKRNIIDCHEHLPPERQRTDTPQDVFTLFSHYTQNDLLSAGMDRAGYDGVLPRADKLPEYESLFDHSIPLEHRWRTFEPYWRRIRFGSYARAAILTAKQVYAVDDINERTYQILSERIDAENTPGVYRRILCDRCRIAVALTQCNQTNLQRPLVPLMGTYKITHLRTRDQLETLADEFGKPVSNFDDYLLVADTQLKNWLDEGIVGIKIISQFNLLPDRQAAECAFSHLLNGQELVADDRGFEPLDNFLLHHVIDRAAELNLVVAVHAGIWGDFRKLDAKHMLTLAPIHPQADFDLYHLGMPAVRDAIVIAKNMPNVFLNLCWTHIISQVQARSGIDELIDQVPVNKVLAFGGDYSRPVEKIVGHLHMARENLARVFARRIDRGLIQFDQAIEIIKLWFWDNPLALYTKLSV